MNIRSTPYISIIVPVYNNPVELDRCLGSIHQNNISDQAEIIVVDDCSPGTGERIKNISAKYKAIYYRQQKNAGPGVARNQGAYLAKGEVLVFIDSDCVAPADWLFRLVHPITRGKYMSVTSCYSGPVNHSWITTFQDEDYRYRMPSTECFISFVNSCNFAIDRRTFLDCGGFPPQRISEDMVLGMMLAKKGIPTRFLPDAGVQHAYYGSIGSYLKQRFSFAFNTIRSHLSPDRHYSKKADSGIRSFNPVRTGAALFFMFAALTCFAAAGMMSFSDFDQAGFFIVAGLVSMLLEAGVHARFLFFLAGRQGLRKSVSYIFLLYLIDLVYVLAVVRAAAGRIFSRRA